MTKKLIALLSLFIGFSWIASGRGDTANAIQADSSQTNLVATNINISEPTKEIDQNAFQYVSAKGKESAIEISWFLDYELAGVLKDKKVIIKYATHIDADRAQKGMGDNWQYTEPIPATNVKYVIKDLQGNEKYEFYIGLSKTAEIPSLDNAEDIVWSEKIKSKTDRGWGVLKFLVLFGSLGLFIFGMKIMSDGLQRAAGPKLRQMLGSITANRVKGVITGFMSTAIVQSSSVTTVMTVSLVNAGLLNLRQSAGVMMGANIGTTVTAWLVLLLGFKVDISSYALMLIAFGMPFLFMTFERSKEIANSIIGFAILFIGLQYLKDTVPDLDKDSPIVQFFINYKDIPVISNLMFVGLGAPGNGYSTILFRGYGLNLNHGFQRYYSL